MIVLVKVYILTAVDHSPPIYTPVEDITVTCGFSGNQFNRYDNQTWSGDVNSIFSPIVGNTSQVRKAPHSSSSTASHVPYTTARLSKSSFTNRFNLTTGQKFIPLYFYPVSYANFYRSKSLFSVKAGIFALLDDFNPFVTADDNGVETLYREFCLNIGDEQSLNITFSPSTDAYAFINGIEIVSMPTNLYYSPYKNHRIGITSAIENNTALEMVYRINIGGSSLSFNEDTGMYRNWEGEDETYLDDFSLHFSILQQNSSSELHFATIPEYTAPAEVYQTRRSMGMNKTINKSYNLTWIFPVDSNFNYLIRLHFCEFQPDITRYGDRRFQIYIDSENVEEGADVIQWSGGNGIPVYRDYTVFMSSVKDERKVNLFLTLAAFQKDWLTSYNDGILNGIEIFKLNDSDGSYKARTFFYIDSRPIPPQVKRQKSQNNSTMLTIVTSVVSSILALSVIGFLAFRRGWKVKYSGSSHEAKKSMQTHRSSLPTYMCRYFSLAEIKAATKNFNFRIGVGGFGNVYKGWIDSGATLVVIKRLKPDSSQGAHEFKTEIEMLSQLRHRHLVSLIGYCDDEGEMILVYDYMACGTLSDHLDQTNNPPLPWEHRLQICIGAARGLQYLHSGTRGTIIHRDVKSTNILLDDKWVAKVSDFGLSKGTTNMSKTHISTLVKGSFGYLDPEYYRRRRLTEKSDVYSFGVVLCEVLCARPAVINAEEIRQASLAEWAKSCYRNGELDQIIDPSLRGKIATECLNKFTEVAISCMHDNGIERPSMTDVVRDLELALQLQQRAEGNINCTERNVETETSSSEQSCATNDSIKCISATIFSEINNPSGR
ncbi:putative protein kinase RLK-Pelle-CrRLK1L-1 family [Rosa chinensis]|uniref:Protein kinase domain-containing protein n=1 Tax=Rosa chinensis TaxID=74649 RepID=A0A2P6RE08_ROSCH|nr:putative protein kinase RLK-Pelle-CrRLK1L-1 family [Rosa chinensis]